MKPFDRRFLVGRLEQNKNWDVLIIGGGATGLGLAVDAATRGFKTLLVEQSDFAKATSSRSTKLVHGGVRYLAQGNIHLVREALRERGLLLKNAPHLTRNESIIIPCYSWMTGLFYLIGLKLYDWLSGGLSLGSSRMIGKAEVLRRLPNVNQKSLKCGVLYHDGAFDDSRLAINLAQTAIENDAVVLNYFKAEMLRKESGKIIGAVIADQETGSRYEVECRVVINATGVFSDSILQMDKPEAKPIIRPSQGVHLVFDRSFLGGSDGLLIPKTDDGRVLFALPWHHKILVGTTDTPLDSHTLEPRALPKEIDFILANAGKYFSKMPSKKDVLSVYAGLRPLAATGSGNDKTKEISRGHKIIVAGSGLISVIGGKWTTYRKMAEDTFLKISQYGKLPAATCRTQALKIHGYKEEVTTEDFDVYGADGPLLEQLKREDPRLGTILSEELGVSAAQVVWAVRNEMARTVEDVLARRIRVLFLDAKEAIRLAPAVAGIMKDELGCDDDWENRQIADFITTAKGYILNDG